jgi:hypothetical protein
MIDAQARSLGVVTMRPLTSGTFQKLMRAAFPGLRADREVHRLLLSYVLSNPNVDVAIVGMRRAVEVEENVAICDDLTSRYDLAEIHQRFVEGNGPRE